MKINIAELSKVHVLVALYKNAKPFTSEGVFVFKLSQVIAGKKPQVNQLPSSFMPSGKQLKIIQQDMESRNYKSDILDIGCGPRFLVVDLSGSEFDSDLYDKFNGKGSAQTAVTALRGVLIVEKFYVAGFFPPKPEGVSENVERANKFGASDTPSPLVLN